MGVPALSPEPSVAFNVYTQSPLEFVVVPVGQVPDEPVVEVGVAVQISDELDTVVPLGQVYVVVVEPVDTLAVQVEVDDVEPSGQS